MTKGREVTYLTREVLSTPSEACNPLHPLSSRPERSAVERSAVRPHKCERPALRASLSPVKLLSLAEASALRTNIRSGPRRTNCFTARSRANALSLSHLTYCTTTTIRICHSLDHPPFPCRDKLKRLPGPSQERHHECQYPLRSIKSNSIPKSSRSLNVVNNSRFGPSATMRPSRIMTTRSISGKISAR